MNAPSLSKADVHAMVNELQDPVDIEELIYRLYVKEKLLRGERDAAAGKVTSHEDVRREASSWRR